MNITIKPCKICGKISAPASKSEMQRVIAAALLTKGETAIINPYLCNDSHAAIRIAKSLGAIVFENDKKIIIKGGLAPINNLINCGESGLSIRMFSAITALCKEKITLQAEGSLKERPLKLVEKPLSELGALCKTENGHAPITIQGPLNGGIIDIDGSLSSQFLTGLLMALPCAENDSKIIVRNLKSTPYIDLTISVLKKFGIEIENNNYEEFYIKGNQQYKPVVYEVEGDWSGAAFLLVAGAIGGSVTIKNLYSESYQADKKILDVLKQVGAEIKINKSSISATNHYLNSFSFDATNCPDLFPPLVVLAANCNGVSKIKGVSRLIHKESNRADSLKNEFSKLGIKIDIINDEMQITGGKITGGKIFSHNDHRIAMAGAIAAINSDDKIEIEHAECVEKSYPTFYEDIQFLGGKKYE